MKRQNVRTLSFIVSCLTYLLVGATIFESLESFNEKTTKKRLDQIEDYYKNTYNITDEEYQNLENFVLDNYLYNENKPQWGFTGSAFFSLTVITTIGYGHCTPQTKPGKLFCILYSMIGIPLCLTMFQSVGDRLNNFTSFCLKLVKRCALMWRRRNRFGDDEIIQEPDKRAVQIELIIASATYTLIALIGGAAMFSHYENWSYFDSIYYCVITLTTIGFGDFVALKESLPNKAYVALAFTFILFGLAVLASSLNLVMLNLLTMNTDDQLRQEYLSKAGKLTNNLRFSASDLLNAVDENYLYALSPEDIDELRKENNLDLSCIVCGGKCGESSKDVYLDQANFIFYEKDTFRPQKQPPTQSDTNSQSVDKTETDNYI